MSSLLLGRPRLLALAAAAAATVAVSVGLATATDASARTYSQAAALCPDGAACVFQHTNYDGKYVAFRSGIADFRAFGFSDLNSSYLNDSPSNFCLYENVDYAWDNDLGRGYQIRPWAYRANTHGYPSYADVASSGYKFSWGQVRCGLRQVN